MKVEIRVVRARRRLEEDLRYVNLINYGEGEPCLTRR